MRNDYLRRYEDRYRVSRGEDGVTYIQTRYQARDGMTFDVYAFSGTHLAACLPPLAGASLLNRMPDVFALHQDAEDAKVLLFPEERLDEVAGALKLRRRREGRTLSGKEREKLTEAGQRFRFHTGHKSERSAAEPTISR